MTGRGPYTVLYEPRALKELTKLDKLVARRIVRAVDVLRVEPRRTSGLTQNWLCYW